MGIFAGVDCSTAVNTDRRFGVASAGIGNLLASDAKIRSVLRSKTHQQEAAQPTAIEAKPANIAKAIMLGVKRVGAKPASTIKVNSGKCVKYSVKENSDDALAIVP